MNSLIEKGARILHKKLDTAIKKLDKELPDPETVPPYHSLSPINNANVADYIQALQWALDNRKTESIYNIALTGPYGSGKSSILKTFQQQNINKDNVFLEISLATFKEEVTEESAKSNCQTGNGEDQENIDPDQNKAGKRSEDVLRLIELSILQQIFYHEEDKKIPDSRFKKIKSFKRKNMIWVTVGIMTTLLFGFYLFFPVKIQDTLGINFPDTTSLLLRWLSVVIFLAALSIVIFRSIRLFYGIQVSKFKFNEAEIEIDKNISKSILNNHLDEILYFFEVTDYSVVLIEDLDRFRQSEIFTKLRELNLLINNSKKVKQEVVFIYAVRDEIFRDKERTKFFDFIIPVIPVINASNSNETLSKIIENNNYSISKDLVEDIALFIDDMRLLYNVTNEYHLYNKLLDDELDQNKLLAIIVYKNIYPDDFVLLADEKGKLYELLNSRKIYIKKALAAIDLKIAANKSEIKTIENHLIKDETELRMIYLAAYVDEIKSFEGFVIQGTSRTIMEIAEDRDLFDYIINGDVNYNECYTQYGNLYQREIRTKIHFENIEQAINSDQSFLERLNLITAYSEDHLENLKREIQSMEREKTTIRHSKIKTLLSDKSLGITIDTSNRQGLLFSVLLNSGYIDEDYLDYISLFYEGSITKEDRSYLLNVKSQTGLEYDFNLTKIDNLIDKIRIGDFQESYILNYNLVDHLLTNETYASQLSSLLGQLTDEKEYGPVFIDGFLLNGTNIELFVKQISSRWSGFWKYVDTISDYTKERKEEYLKLILSYADIQDVEKMTTQSSLYNRIALSNNFLSLIGDDNKTKEIIKNLQIKFFNLDFSNGSSELAKFIYEGNYYQITTVMIEKVIKHTGKFNRADFDSANYKAIQNSESTFLTKYIEDNIDTYINNIYLKSSQNNNEPEVTLIELLNNDKIKLENRVKIIEQVDTKISDLTLIEFNDIRETLLKNNKIVPTWDNLIESYVENEQIFSVEFITFLNYTENAIALSNEEIDTENFDADLGVVEAFILALINEPKITDNNYELLLNAIPGVYNISDIGAISFNKMQLLIDSISIITNAENFAKLKADYPELQRPLLEKTQESFLDYISEYELDVNDLLYLLQSSAFSPSDKNKIVNTIDASLITSTRALAVITKLIFDNSIFQVPKPVLMAALKNGLPINERVKLFNMHYLLFTKTEIPEIFGTFPYPFSDIGVLHKSPVIPFGQEHEFLATNLKNQGFIANRKDDKRGIRIINFKK